MHQLLLDLVLPLLWEGLVCVIRDDEDGFVKEVGASPQAVSSQFASDRLPYGLSLIARNPVHSTMAVLQYILQGESGDHRYPVVWRS